MSDSRTVNEFIDTTASLYGYTITDLKRRELKFKLAMADIKETVSSDDYNLALGLILSDLDPKLGSVKTASFSKADNICPRCSSMMCNVKLGTSTDAMYCSACHVTVPLR
jgi:ribosomal protein S27AE